jgi:hypothetical protein
MYRRCHLCNRPLGENTLVAHMAVGRCLAYDVERGRLWVVCRRCDEWNLTPLEERWEAVEECERLFARAEVRASSANVGVATVDGVRLIRVGPAMRDELANTRYGPRLRRRRWRRAMLSTALGTGAGAMVGGFALLVGTSLPMMPALYLTAYAACATLLLKRDARSLRSAHFVDGRGIHVRLGSAALRLAIGERHAPRRPSRGRADGRGRKPRLVLITAQGEGELRYVGEAALVPLAAILPHLNAGGASATEVAAATRLVDEAESRGPDAWMGLLQGSHGCPEHLSERSPALRLALEIAVTEELERRALAGDAAALHDRSASAEEIASIADDMFLPRAVTEWIARRRASTA